MVQAHHTRTLTVLKLSRDRTKLRPISKTVTPASTLNASWNRPRSLWKSGSGGAGAKGVGHHDGEGARPLAGPPICALLPRGAHQAAHSHNVRNHGISKITCICAKLTCMCTKLTCMFANATCMLSDVIEEDQQSRISRLNEQISCCVLTCNVGNFTPLLA